MNEALRGLWKALGISSPPPGVGVAPEKGERVVAHHVLRREGRRKKAYLRAVHEGWLKDVLEGARFLRPFLSGAGFSDLEEALLTLPRLEDGEIRQEGPYVVARKGETWTLFRGVLFGNPALDGAFLVGDTVTLLLREGAEIALRGYFFEKRVNLSEMRIRWGEERADYHGRGLGPSYPVLEDHLISHLLRPALREFTGSASLPARIAALAEEALELRPEEFLKALGSEAFFRRARLRALSRL
jgi:hypothetical protein